MSQSMDDALQTFIIESRELLEQMEDALLRIEQQPDDADTINAIFRAAHTIKGSAGLFGLDGIVAFTHVAESVLDKVRDGHLPMSSELVATFLAVCDHLRTLIANVAEHRHADEDTRNTEHCLLGQLQTQLGEPGQQNVDTAKPPVQTRQVDASGGGVVDSDHWHLSLRFGQDLLRNGMDPFAFLRYLATLGDIVSIVTLTDPIPALAELDAESCHLGFEIAFRSNADKATIEGVFEFARDDSVIRILPPHSKVSEYLQLIEDLPGEPLRLGEILVRCGTLTQAELDDALRQQDAQQRPIGEVLVAQQIVESSVVEAALDKQKQVKEARSAEASLIRIDAGKLDQLINLVGELIIAGASANLAAERHGASELLEATALLSRLVEEVRDSALYLRMVQIGATFNRFQRVVRDVSKELGKEIDLVINGADTELDKTVVERIGDPLTHLVRNAIDHGIGLPEAREAKGKPRRGRLELNAYHDSGSIVIEVSDDGAGLQKERILAKARERGLIKPDQVLSDKEIFNLVFEPGFSTASSISNISGRGVGMDVVRQNINALRGTVELDSIEGQGTTVRIRLPLTLAIIDGFLIGIGKASYVVPLDTVVECIELSEGNWENHGRDYINLRGEVLPFIRLRDMFEVEGAPPARQNVVVIQYGSQRAGLVVDQLMGEYQTVIKPLGKVFSHVRGIGGFTILGTGEVALILDVPGLIRQVLEAAAFSEAA